MVSSDKGLADIGASLLREELPMPCAVLYDSRLRHNLQWMQGFVDAYGLKLAPHGKTTMTPALFLRQIEGGAWGITVATAQQAVVAAQSGIRRVVMANQLAGRRNMEIVAKLLRDPALDFYCLVDSVDGVHRMAEVFTRPVQVLLELAPTPDQANFRTGVRSDEALNAVLAELRRHPDIHLRGIEIYEGVLKEEDEIRVFLKRAVSALTVIAAAGGFHGRPILSGAGSAWYDVVAEEFAEVKEMADVVLRPGCYLTHDVGIYKQAQARIETRNPIAARMREGLKPALHLWACVQSLPDAARAVIGFGKRDAAFDAGFAEPALRFRRGDTEPSATPSHWRITSMMDQHAFMEIAAGDDLRVGDYIGFDISHPCLTFDKWRKLLLLDDNWQVKEVFDTYF